MESARANAELINAAAAVMRCEYCRQQTTDGDQPQPGWVGNQYALGSGVVIVMQNPGVAPRDYGTQREASVQQLLRKFSDWPTPETYSQLMRFMIADMAGEKGGPAWKKWTHPVSKLIPDRERIAWMNVVKFRTPGLGRKDAPVTSDAVQHGSVHLRREIEILKPKAVVAIGSAARNAVEMLQLPPSTITRHLKLQGASNYEVEQLRQDLLTFQADIG